jgi:hypothetical protein
MRKDAILIGTRCFCTRSNWLPESFAQNIAIYKEIGRPTNAFVQMHHLLWFEQVEQDPSITPGILEIIDNHERPSPFATLLQALLLQLCHDR